MDTRQGGGGDLREGYVCSMTNRRIVNCLVQIAEYVVYGGSSFFLVFMLLMFQFLLLFKQQLQLLLF